MGSLMKVLFVGLGLVFIPLVIIALAFMGGASWDTVGQEVALPILAIFIMGVAFIFLSEYW